MEGERNSHSGLSGKWELLEMLDERLTAFLALDEDDQDRIDAARFVPTREMHDILFYVVTMNRFSDEDEDLIG